MNAEDPVAGVRILAVCGGMVTAGGAERMVFEVLRALRQSGAEVHCVLNNWAFEHIVAMVEDIGATWSQTSFSVRLNRHARGVRPYLTQLRDVLQSHRDLWSAARRFKPTHVVVPDHESVLRTFGTLVALRLTGVRVVMKLCNAPVQTPFYRRLWRWVVNAAVTEFVANSEFTQAELRAVGISVRKTSLVFETTPARTTRRLPGPRDPQKAIFVGQIIPEKGLHILLDAIGLLVAEGHDVRLDVVGDMEGWISPRYGNYRRRLKTRAAEEDLASRVSFLGWCDDVPALMAESAVHVCPSLPQTRESFGLVVVEAKTAGIPSVVFKSGALTELVASGVNGVVCDEPTARALADGIAWAISDPARAAVAGKAAAASVQRFSRDDFAREWVNVFTPLSARSVRTGPQPQLARG